MPDLRPGLGVQAGLGFFRIGRQLAHSSPDPLHDVAIGLGSNQSGKNDPCRSLGIATSIVPTRVSRSRCRYPLRRLIRSCVRVPYSAPHTLSACADSSAWMNVVSMSRQVGAGLREFVMQEAGRVDTGCSGHRGAPIRDGCERSLEGSHR